MTNTEYLTRFFDEKEARGRSGEKEGEKEDTGKDEEKGSDKEEDGFNDVTMNRCFIFQF